MFITKKHLPRRTVLQGLGATLALPLLDSMIPARTLLAKTAANPSSRLGFVYVPHGAIMPEWTPATEGTGFELTRILKPLEPFHGYLNVVSGLGHKAADTTAVHSLSPTTWLSGVRPKPTQGVDAYALPPEFGPVMTATASNRSVARSQGTTVRSPRQRTGSGLKSPSSVRPPFSEPRSGSPSRSSGRHSVTPVCRRRRERPGPRDRPRGRRRAGTARPARPRARRKRLRSAGRRALRRRTKTRGERAEILVSARPKSEVWNRFARFSVAPTRASARTRPSAPMRTRRSSVARCSSCSRRSAKRR